MIRYIHDESNKHERDFLSLKEENLTPDVADMMITHVDFLFLKDIGITM